MLVLSRKINEKIVIGDMIEVSVLELTRDRVKLGISAPKKISVHRKEVYELIQEENIQASQAATQDMKKIMELMRKPKNK